MNTPSQPGRDRILASQIHGKARHQARWREVTADEHAAAAGAWRRGRTEQARAGQ